MSNLKRAADQIASLHNLDLALRDKAVAERRREKEHAALEDEARSRRSGQTPSAGTVI